MELISFSRPLTLVDPAMPPDIILKLEARITELESTTRPLQSAEGKAIKLYNLGFLSKLEADVWVELHAPGGKFGYTVNFYTLMEHVYHIIHGVNFLK